MAQSETEKPARVLDPIERASEVIFGLLMAMTFIGALSAATAGREEVRTMMFTAIGCNLAWGLADAVMYLVRIATNRTRNRTMLTKVRAEPDAAKGRALVEEALPRSIVEAAGSEGVDAIHRRLIAPAAPDVRPVLAGTDFRGAVGVFLLVVLATFPVVIPFMLFDQASIAIRVSNGVAVAMLFLAGEVLGRYAGARPWRGGLWMAVTGILLMAAIMALGG
ncbi:hypothetical protein DSM104443_02295 [Usitatibacter rugosus]|uniref:VIT family protein n=1 Tax=Usitatibacter rugosus TaxID=2732067 RepID=A0A6M4GW17_9PROT|nr:VIT1/CCC1 transporter family protein [Usitatibacter rugosus]QJR11222.1 hypothetical protein DSM104443_02295 [Usitatibacter rugosus]